MLSILKAIALVALLATPVTGQLDNAGCRNLLNSIKERGITVDFQGDLASPEFTSDELHKNKLTVDEVKLYNQDCLKMEELPEFTCPVTMKVTNKLRNEFQRNFRAVY